MIDHNKLIEEAEILVANNDLEEKGAASVSRLVQVITKDGDLYELSVTLSRPSQMVPYLGDD
jgi:predicted nuclease of predicted toxin-antitoxin system